MIKSLRIVKQQWSYDNLRTVEADKIYDMKKSEKIKNSSRSLRKISHIAKLYIHIEHIDTSTSVRCQYQVFYLQHI